MTPKKEIKVEPEEEETIGSSIAKRQRRIRKIKKEETSEEEEPRIKRVKIKTKKYIASVKEKSVIRRVRCNQCHGCSRDNCNECRFCLDMKKNGGEGKLRQSCAMRFCKDVSNMASKSTRFFLRTPSASNVFIDVLNKNLSKKQEKLI